MEYWICRTCGTQFAASEQPPEDCAICHEERQYVGYNGQEWTTLALLKQEGLHNIWQEHEPHLYGVGSVPTFAIGERALLLQSPGGNILWDCITLLDEETATRVDELGGIAAIVISHPHYYTTML